MASLTVAGEKIHYQLSALNDVYAVRTRTMTSKGKEKSKTLNFNVGILGHIDSGKTSLGRHVAAHVSLYVMGTCAWNAVSMHICT